MMAWRQHNLPVYRYNEARNTQCIAGFFVAQSNQGLCCLRIIFFCLAYGINDGYA